MPTPFAVGTVFAYIMVADPVTLIDTGVGYPPGRAALLEGLKANGLAVADIQRILLTHGHIDHIGNAGWLQERCGAEVWIHPEEGAKFAPGLLSSDQWRHQLTLAGMPEAEQDHTYRLYEMGQRMITAPQWQPLQDGQRFPFANGAALEAVVLPGHSLGHTAFRLGDQLFGGDHLLLGVTPNPIMEIVSPGHEAAVPHAPGRALTLGQFLASLEKVTALDLTAVWPGHGPVIQDHRKVAATYITTHERRLHQIEQSLGAGKTAWTLSRELYPRVRDFDLFLALSEVLAHLDLLVVRNRIALDGMLFHPVEPC